MSIPAALSKSNPIWDSEAVSSFATGDVDVLVLERQIPGDLQQAVDAGRFHEFFAPLVRSKVGLEVRCGLRELRIRSSELEADLIGLVNSFLDQFDLEEARLRIELTQSQACPKFHCDNVNVRLVTTYVGPTTEYQYAGDKVVHAAPVGSLVFLKGHRNASCLDSVHHRSPEVAAGQRRLCVAIDF